MDPSALIFVALAVAWAVYLIPKALEHHEEGARTRTVERFSATLRVLARREPINRRKARLVAGAEDATTTAATVTATSTVSRTSSRREVLVEAEPFTPVQLRGRRQAAARAAKRRLRVVSLILVANAVVVALAYLNVVEWVWCAAPVGLLIAWLVACRLMVKRERAQLPRRRIPAEVAPEKPKDQTEEIAQVDAPLLDEPAAAVPDPDSWDPVPVTLPTYVSKPVAPRSVSTIDLDSTGVWSSGRNASDSALAREADATEAADRAAAKSAADRRSFGS